MTYEEIVDAYISYCRPDADAEAQEFRQLPSLNEAIQHAALCHWLIKSKPPQFKKHPHQYLIPETLLQDAEGRLQNASGTLSAVAEFEALHEAVGKAIGKKQGLGELAVYDIAQRIGAFLRKEPKLVYLHRGVREGAHALGFHGDTLDPTLLPPAFSRLTPAEIEDCLCIFKNDLRDNQLRTGVLQRVSHCISSIKNRVRKC
jgi:hypothetical protein